MPGIVNPLLQDPLAELVIHTATNGEKQHSFKLGETEVRGKTMRGCVLALGKHMGWGSTAAAIIENLRNLPASQNTDLLVSILEGNDA
jgi:ribosomal protein L16 Arg81 hydroxylase